MPLGVIMPLGVAPPPIMPLGVAPEPIMPLERIQAIDPQ
jgi:hypothetical protein